MRTFEETKTFEIDNPDLERGYLQRDTLLKVHHEGIPEKVLKTAEEIAKELECEGREITRSKDGKIYLTMAYYPETDGRTVKEILPQIQEEVVAWDEFEEIQVYIPYSTKRYIEIQIQKYKDNLRDSDYKAIKYAEGFISENDYKSVKKQRQQWRDEINKLEKELQNIED